MASELSVGSIGCGNMARALIGRWLSTQTLTATAVRACTTRRETCQQVVETLGITCTLDLPAAAKAQVVLLAFKPQQRGAVLSQLAALAVKQPDTLWISLLAGVPLAELRASLGPQAKVVRWMPNTPVRLGLGAVAMCGAEDLPLVDRQRAEKLLQPLGKYYLLEEAQFDAFTAVAGCGPAYVFALCEALQQAAQASDFPEAIAAQLARQTVVGAAALLQHSAGSAAELRAEVTSRGGMTEAALARLHAGAWAEQLVAAVAAAQQRGRELAAKPN